MVGPEVPEKIQKIRARRLGRKVIQEGSESSSDDDFAGPSLNEFKNGESINEDAAAKERLRSGKIEQLKGQRVNGTNDNDLKHDSWMSMKPEWAGKLASDADNVQPANTDSAKSITRSEKPSLMKQHEDNRRKLGLDEKDNVSYDTNESLNAEVRKEVFRKASNLNDRFTRGSQ